MMFLVSSHTLSNIPDISIIESSTYIQVENGVQSDDEGGYKYYGFPIEYNGNKWIFSNQLNMNNGKLKLNNHIYLDVKVNDLSNFNVKELSIIDGNNNFKVKSVMVEKPGFLIVNYPINNPRFSLFTWDMIEYKPVTKDYIQHGYLYIYDSKNKTIAYLETFDPKIHKKLNDFLNSRRICILEGRDYKIVNGNIIKFSCTQTDLILGASKKNTKTILEVQALDEENTAGKYFKIINSNRTVYEKKLY